MISIVDCGSQYTQNIARRIREQGVYTEIVPYRESDSLLTNPNLDGIVISGGQFSVHDNDAPTYSPRLLQSSVPILGICYGLQSICDLFGGEVRTSDKREYGETDVEILEESLLFDELPRDLIVWMSHGDVVIKVPDGFDILARSGSGHVAAIQSGDIYAVQFHPEVDHTEYGRKILENFIRICGAQKTWDPERYFERVYEKTKDEVEGKIGVGGISGGVDSSTVSVLLGKIVGRDYHPIFVDNGLLRLNEPEEVKQSLEPFGLNVHFVDASERFLSRLKGIKDPDTKREIIGNEFYAVFEEEAGKIPCATYLAQGTLYPDVIESVPVYGSSSKIKRHHNVGGLPEKMNLEVVEPFRDLFKDEVRRIAWEKLGMPRTVVWRHPFPGPGLAIRIKGDVTQDKLDIVRQADSIFVEELKNKGVYYEISQAFAGLNDSSAVGVMGDGGTYESEVRLRAVVTNDFMTSDIFHFEWGDLQAITNRIVNEVKGVNRVFYDTTQKPPGTIEWE